MLKDRNVFSLVLRNFKFFDCRVKNKFIPRYDREHIPINEAFDNQTFHQMIFAAEEDFATTTTYAIAPWTKGEFFGVPAPNKIVRYRIFDFYIMREDKIWYNWMILDAVHLLYQAGYDILPNNNSPLKQGWSLPPKAMDGLPAPWSRIVKPEDSKTAKVNYGSEKDQNGL